MSKPVDFYMGVYPAGSLTYHMRYGCTENAVTAFCFLIPKLLHVPLYRKIFCLCSPVHELTLFRTVRLPKPLEPYELDDVAREWSSKN